MKQARNLAVVNGGLIGLGVGWLIQTWCAYAFTQKVQAVAEAASVKIPGVWPAILAGLVGGVICIALGVGLEAYQRIVLKRSVYPSQ